MKCPKCQAELPADVHFCGVCGEAKDQYLYITETPEVRFGFSKIAQK